MQLENRRFLNVLFLVGLGVICSCAIILKGPEKFERVEAKFFLIPTSSRVSTSYAVKLPEQRIIRRLVIHTLYPIRNTAVYVRVGEDMWKIAKQIKGKIEGETTVDITVRGDAVRVTDPMGFIQDVEVFVVPKSN